VCLLPALALVVAPALLTIALDGRPIRFGAPLPAAAVAAGLRLEGNGVLQWRRLPVGAPDATTVWVELAIVGPPGTVRIVAGGAHACPDGRGDAFVRAQKDVELAHGRERTVQWRWCDGSVDELRRLEVTAPCELDGERYAAGEWRSLASGAFAARSEVVVRLPRAWSVAIGAMPPCGAGGETTKALRAHVARLLPRLRELPGARGAGDYARADGVVTNLEFDTTLALVRCALGLGDVGAWSRACRSARHLVDRDLDPRTGLPFPHGAEHRGGVPEPGHAWLQGVLWVGLLAADDELIAAARGLGLAIAAHPPAGEGRHERLRDHGWPLLELEALLRVAPEPALARTADAYAASIARRFDATARTFRFGEGEVGGGVYLERGWLTGGLLLPALRAHLRRRPDARLAAHVDAVEQALLDRIGRGRGLPTHWRVAGRETFAEHREEGTAAAAFLLEALAPVDLQRLLRRSTVRAAVTAMPSPDDPDLATQLSLLARCEWPWR
jgi:hypothetical protein